MIDVLSLEYEELKDKIVELGYEKYRAEQVFNFLYKHRIEDFSEITVLKKDVRETLKKKFFIYRFKSVRSVEAEDGTKKYLFELNDGLFIESVLIPMDKNRYTICVSTQVGCRMGCKFCATGRMGFKRNLTVSEIVNQVRYILKENNLKTANVVYMGMGEPLDNYENSIKSIRILIDDKAFAISKRRITLSTCGITPMIEKLKKDLPYINLAISLHSAIQKKRSLIMPVNERYPIDEVLKSLKDFPLPRRKRITFEYVMIKGINDTKYDAKALLRVMSNFKSKLNIIPLNKHDLLGTKFEPTPMDRIEEFADYLRSKGMFVTVRKSKGSNINAACGMLATKVS